MEIIVYSICDSEKKESEHRKKLLQFNKTEYQIIFMIDRAAMHVSVRRS